MRQVTDPDRVQVHRPDRCEGCGAGLRRAPVVSVEIRQVFDLPPVRITVSEHRIEHRRYRCGTTTMAQVSAGVAAPVQYGPRVRAVAGYLVGYQHLPYERAAETLVDLLGVGMSTGCLASVVAATGQRLDGFRDTVRDRLATAPVAHFDEIGLRVAGTGGWVHAACTDRLSLFTVHASRGHEAIAAAGVLPVFAGIAVHDGFTPYRRYGAAHQLCNAPHLRELAALVEADRQHWAQQMISLLCEMNDLARHARTVGADAIGSGVLAMWRQRYDELIETGRTANPDPGGQQAHLVIDPEAVAAIQAWVRLDQAMARFNSHLQRRHGLTGAQLAMLRLVVEWDPQVPLADLRRRLVMHPATIGQLLDRLAVH